MRFAVISDIHGNHIALEAILNEIGSAGIDGILFLGDYVTDFPGGKQVIDLIRETERRTFCKVIRGNREDYMIEQRYGRTDPWEAGSTSSGSLYHAYHSLTEEDLDYLEKLPVSLTFAPEGAPAVTLCHASPASCRESIYYDQKKVCDYLDTVPGSVLLCGHQHLTRTVRHGGKTAFFIGSACGADGSAGMAQFAYLTLNGGRWYIENRMVRFDVRRAAAEFRTSGLLECGRLWARMRRASALSGISLVPVFAERGWTAIRRAAADADREAIWQAAFDELEIGSIEKAFDADT